jgi:hypothetical protein
MLTRSLLLLVLAAGLAGAQAAPVTLTTDCTKVSAVGGDHATMDHMAHMAAIKECEKARAELMLPKQGGQATFAAIQEIVRILDTDPQTDWTRVNIEGLRRHLQDMDDVTMHAKVMQRPVEGGFQAEVTGSGATKGAIQRMVVDHSKMMNGVDGYVVRADSIATGVRLTVRAAAGDAKAVARIRGLGVIGFLTEGTHHVRHHLAIARGEAGAHEH